LIASRSSAACSPSSLAIATSVSRHDLEFRERTFRAHFLDPLFEKGELGAFLGQFRMEFGMNTT
jgi:hypothetical protein